MGPENAQGVAPRQSVAMALRNWAMVAITIIFVALYGAALVGWYKPLMYEKVVSRLEPIIFVFIGYYFGRLPAQQHEKTLRAEIKRQIQKAEAAQCATSQAQQDTKALEEKLKNVKAALASANPRTSAAALTEKLDDLDRLIKAESLRHSINIALDILDS